MFGMDWKNTINWAGIQAALFGISAKARMEAALYLQAKAKEYCPVDTGFLRDSIIIRQSKDGSLSVVATAYYAHWVEFGHHSARHTSDVGVHYREAAIEKPRKKGQFAPQEAGMSAGGIGRDGKPKLVRARYEHMVGVGQTGVVGFAPRPFMRPALYETAKKFPHIVKKLKASMQVQSNPGGANLDPSAAAGYSPVSYQSLGVGI